MVRSCHVSDAVVNAFRRRPGNFVRITCVSPSSQCVPLSEPSPYPEVECCALPLLAVEPVKSRIDVLRRRSRIGDRMPDVAEAPLT